MSINYHAANAWISPLRALTRTTVEMMERGVWVWLFLFGMVTDNQLPIISSVAKA